MIPPLRPMLAKSAEVLPAPETIDGGFGYEPKWDGFRAVIFRDGDEVSLCSRSTKDLGRYFPELVAAVHEQLPQRCVMDGEIIIAVGDRLDFDTLSQRVHPAASRIASLAEQTPAKLVVFDLLALAGQSLLNQPFQERRAALESVLTAATAPIHLTAITYHLVEAERWFHLFEGAGLDGIVAKPLAAPYTPNGRTMVKVKHARTADVVVAGCRLHKNSSESKPLLGSLLLGLYADDGRLQHVGVCASFSQLHRAELIEELTPRILDSPNHPWVQREDAQAAGRLPGAQSRWTGSKDLSFVPLEPTLVAEVGYEHMEGQGESARFRHTAQFKRWRPDRDARSCTYAQLEEVVDYDLAEVFSS